MSQSSAGHCPAAAAGGRPPAALQGMGERGGGGGLGAVVSNKVRGGIRQLRCMGWGWGWVGLGWGRAAANICRR
eukprot:364811-Chlamydomonas_euryale.AAC.5